MNLFKNHQGLRVKQVSSMVLKSMLVKDIPPNKYWLKSDTGMSVQEFCRKCNITDPILPQRQEMDGQVLYECIQQRQNEIKDNEARITSTFVTDDIRLSTTCNNLNTYQASFIDKIEKSNFNEALIKAANEEMNKQLAQQVLSRTVSAHYVYYRWRGVFYPHSESMYQPGPIRVTYRPMLVLASRNRNNKSIFTGTALKMTSQGDSFMHDGGFQIDDSWVTYETLQSPKYRTTYVIPQFTFPMDLSWEALGSNGYRGFGFETHGAQTVFQAVIEDWKLKCQKNFVKDSVSYDWLFDENDVAPTEDELVEEAKELDKMEDEERKSMTEWLINEVIPLLEKGDAASIYRAREMIYDNGDECDYDTDIMEEAKKRLAKKRKN